MCAGLDDLPIKFNCHSLVLHLQLYNYYAVAFWISKFLVTISEAEPFSQRFDVGHQTILYRKLI